MTQSLDSVTMPSDILSFLSESSQILWGESSYDQLVSKFVEIAHGHFGLERAGFYRIIDKIPAAGLVSANISFRGVPHFRDDFREKLEMSILRTNLYAPEVSSGVSTYHLDGQDFRFVLIGDPAINWQILIWSGTATQDALLDFLAKQLQCGCSWFARLDKTQALLYRDELTGLFNIRYLEVALESEVRRAQRFAASFSLLFIDLDNFKMINDKFGHLAGSSVLKQVAKCLQDASREVDSVIRYGGDEFVIMLLGANPSMGLLAAERIRQAVEDERFVLDDGVHVSLTASIGVASFPDHAKDKQGLLKLADETMYSGKRNGKNRVVLFGKEPVKGVERSINREG